MLSTVGIPMDCVLFVKIFFVINSCDMFHVFPLLYFLSVEISYAALQLTEYLKKKKLCVCSINFG